VSPLGDSRRKAAGGTTHSNYPHLASPFGRGVLRKQDGEGVPSCVRGCDLRKQIGGVVLSLKLSLLSLPQAGEGGPLAVDGDANVVTSHPSGRKQVFSLTPSPTGEGFVRRKNRIHTTNKRFHFTKRHNSLHKPHVLHWQKVFAELFPQKSGFFAKLFYTKKRTYSYKQKAHSKYTV